MTHIDVTRNFDERSIGGMSLLSAQLRYVSEKHRRRKVSLDVGLLERLNLAGKDVLERQGEVVLRLDRFSNHFESQQGGFGTTAKSVCSLAQRALTHEHMVATLSFRPLRRSTILTTSGTRETR